MLVRDHMLFRHNQEGREKVSKGMILSGVAVILAPAAVEAWKEAGSKSPITTPHDSLFVGRFIGVKLYFPRLDQCNRRIRGHIALFVALVYRPVDEVKHSDFTDTLS